MAMERMQEALGAAIERHMRLYFAAHEGRLPPDGLYDRVLREIERPLLMHAMTACQGNQLKAAKLLGLNRNTLRKKLAEFEMDGRQYRRSGTPKAGRTETPAARLARLRQERAIALLADQAEAGLAEKVTVANGKRAA